jgi:hypothetical protein
MGIKNVPNRSCRDILISNSMPLALFARFQIYIFNNQPSLPVTKEPFFSFGATAHILGLGLPP